MENELSDRQKACIPSATFKLIPIKDLVSNQEYQRPLSESHILKAIEEFDVYQINPVKVSRRNGINYVLDGQHTIEIVASKSGSRDTPVWCMVFDELQYREEAHIFAEQQKHVKSLVPYEVFNAHLEAGDEKQLMIVDLVRSYGLDVCGDTKPGKICAVSALEYIYDKYGHHVLDKAICLLLATWEGEKNSLSANMLKGIARIISTFGDALRDDIFKEHVGRLSTRMIARNAKDRRPGALGYAEAMLIAYNAKNKYRLSMRKLYGKSSENDLEDETDEEEYEELDEMGFRR